MIEYTKLFALLKERDMKKTELLKIISPNTLAKLGKNAIVQTDIIDKICIFLGTQPSDIMEVYTTQEINGQNIKIKVRDIENTTKDISYGDKTTQTTGITMSDLRKVVNENGYIDVKKLDELIKIAEYQ